ncbi:unnamed protein product [Caenorhabditis bovis]|uniref:Protein kinase domain-containing protein n=1 Tax=Caenorhabditis bovis TaxID=2654633 RepID=A0A8S1FC26_9PELO|nr:unnamed protein product [Caenorhabditis bovis]
MPRYRTSDDIIVSRLDDGKETRIQLEDMNLFAYGAFSNVYKGVARTESMHRADVVIKKTWPRHRGSSTEVRILAKLNRLKHKNIVKLLYSYQKEHEIKLIAWQLFRGQYHLQRMDICHRDIKPQNLLFNDETGLLKISDFGSSALEARKDPQPSYHVTRYYRPPELLFGAKIYGCEIDIWSCACVFGELLKGSVFLAGKNATNQAELVLDLLGLPSNEDLRNMRVNESKYRDIVSKHEPDSNGPFPNFSFMTNPNPNIRDRRYYVFNSMITKSEMTESVDILQQIMVYNPFKRLCGHELLMNSYFKQIFKEDVVRMNGKKIGCLTMADWNAVRSGDKTITGESTDE